MGDTLCNKALNQQVAGDLGIFGGGHGSIVPKKRVITGPRPRKTCSLLIVYSHARRTEMT
jgi:hypothetical protein